VDYFLRQKSYRICTAGLFFQNFLFILYYLTLKTSVVTFSKWKKLKKEHSIEISILSDNINYVILNSKSIAFCNSVVSCVDKSFWLLNTKSKFFQAYCSHQLNDHGKKTFYPFLKAGVLILFDDIKKCWQTNMHICIF